ncbi:MAG: tripartite tricarboxylate transporter substrate-binding protein, partial [Pseudomonadota bacterium]
MLRRTLLAAACVGLLAPQTLLAQTYPSRPVTIVVPNAAGGGTDTIARVIADQLSKQMNSSFVVENRTGAGMVVGTVAVAKAPPDGHMLLVGLNGNMTVNPSLYA